MKKLLIALSAFLFAALVRAQQIWFPYVLTDVGTGQMTAAQISYRPNGGYEMVAGGQRLSVKVTATEAVANLGGLVFRMPIDGTYWHSRPGQWRVSPFTSSSGEAGIHRMYYVGMEPLGRRYREELVLNGKLFSTSETLIDYNDHIVWSVATDRMGTVRLDRAQPRSCTFCN